MSADDGKELRGSTKLTYSDSQKIRRNPVGWSEGRPQGLGQVTIAMYVISLPPPYVTSPSVPRRRRHRDLKKGALKYKVFASG